MDLKNWRALKVSLVKVYTLDSGNEDFIGLVQWPANFYFQKLFNEQYKQIWGVDKAVTLIVWLSFVEIEFFIFGPNQG